MGSHFSAGVINPLYEYHHSTRADLGCAVFGTLREFLELSSHCGQIARALFGPSDHDRASVPSNTNRKVQNLDVNNALMGRVPPRRSGNFGGGGSRRKIVTTMLTSVRSIVRYLFTLIEIFTSDGQKRFKKSIQFHFYQNHQIEDRTFHTAGANTSPKR